MHGVANAHHNYRVAKQIELEFSFKESSPWKCDKFFDVRRMLTNNFKVIFFTEYFSIVLPDITSEGWILLNDVVVRMAELVKIFHPEEYNYPEV